MNTSSILMAAASMQRMSFSPDFLKRALSQIIADAGVQEVKLPHVSDPHWLSMQTATWGCGMGKGGGKEGSTLCNDVDWRLLPEYPIKILKANTFGSYKSTIRI